MFRALIISTLICLGLANSIVKRNSSFQSIQEPQQQSQQSPIAQNQNNNQLQMNSYLQESLLPSRQYLYPSYPDYSNNRDKIQSRVDEYQVPISPQEKHDWSFGFPQNLIPLATSLILYGSEFWSVLAYFALALVVVGIINILMCTFTNICVINLSDLPLYNSRIKEQVTDLARTYITPESLNAATVYILNAYDKYHTLQRRKREK
ncbi:hypothetical protein M0802_000911 [Mischocyttarus mexicanus]|nr:hypothetical protein M0802_000911 [Mischocyttarus mexicanus]